MDDAPPPPPSIEVFRAVLGAARTFEASTRPPGSGMLASDARGLLVAIRMAAKLDRGYHTLTADRAIAHRAAGAVLSAADAAWFDAKADRAGQQAQGQGGPLWPLDAIISEEGRVELVNAIDALSGSLEVLEAIGRMMPEDQAAIEQEARRGPPVVNAERDEQIRAWRYRDGKTVREVIRLVREHYGDEVKDSRVRQIAPGKDRESWMLANPSKD